MKYRKIVLEMVVGEDEAELLTQALDDAADEISGRTAVFASDIKDRETGEPENAEEIGRKVQWATGRRSSRQCGYVRESEQ